MAGLVSLAACSWAQLPDAEEDWRQVETTLATSVATTEAALRLEQGLGPLALGVESMENAGAGIAGGARTDANDSGRMLFVRPNCGGASGVVVVEFVDERLQLLPDELFAGGTYANDLLGIEGGDLNHHAIGNNLIAI